MTQADLLVCIAAKGQHSDQLANRSRNSLHVKITHRREDGKAYLPAVGVQHVRSLLGAMAPISVDFERIYGDVEDLNPNALGLQSVEHSTSLIGSNPERKEVVSVFAPWLLRRKKYAIHSFEQAPVEASDFPTA